MIFKKEVKELKFQQKKFEELEIHFQKSFIRSIKFIQFFSVLLKKSINKSIKGDNKYTLLLFFQRAEYVDGNYFEVKSVKGDGKNAYIYFQTKYLEGSNNGIIEVKNRKYVYALIEYDQGFNMNGTFDIYDETNE